MYIRVPVSAGTLFSFHHLRLQLCQSLVVKEGNISFENSDFMSAEGSQNSYSFDELIALNKQFDRQLSDLRQSDKKPAGSQGSPFSYKKFLFILFLLGSSIILPFIILVRTSIYFYSAYQFNGWLALACGTMATILLLLGYGLFLAYRYKQRVQIHKYFVRGVVALVIAYTLYGVLYFSSLNTKTDEIKSYYRSLHPIMRVALATTTLADSDLLVTDIWRQPDDYLQMGLPENQQSLHYVQPDGYVHAVDLRTRGRAEWKNWLTRIALGVVGLNSIRHVGTADHLHVYLPLNN